jgi:1-deoxy-D-xylulose-5-phosphate reductoisomerase
VEAGRKGGAAPAVYNAANEQAVELFLRGAMKFGQIPAVIRDALDALGGRPADTKDAVLAADAAARAFVKERFA